MKALVSSLGICALLAFTAGGCGSDDDDGGGTGGKGGTGGGTGGSGGGTGGGTGGSTGGTAGTSSGGTAGSATGGTAGSATGGTAGASATGCEAFCTLVATNCTGNNTQYTGDECANECAGWAEGTPGDMDGDTLACRTYHAGQAAIDADLHCSHAGPDGDNVCVD